MDNLFSKILEMSIDGSFVIAFIFMIRVLLKRAPKIFSYVLWGIVFLRLIIPFSIESSVSIIKVRDRVFQEEKSAEVQYTPSTTLENNPDYNTSYETTSKDIPDIEIEIPKKTNIIPYIWLSGIGLLGIYSIYSTLKLSEKLKDANYIDDNIYIARNIDTAFVFGIIRPKIYLPHGLQENEKEYILKHEQIHLKRRDHIFKFLAFVITSIHWFNPLVWVSYYLMSVDMELSCDEAVVRELGTSIKKDYSRSLLSFSTGRKILTASPIAFGENNVKSRIKNILQYKKPKFWILVLCVILVLGTMVGCLTDSPKMEENSLSENTNGDKEDPIKKVKNYKTEEEYAKAFIEEDIKNLEEEYSKSDSSKDIRIEDYEITSFELIDTFEHIMDTPLEMWKLEYKFKPNKLVAHAPGNVLGDGWLNRFSEVETPYLLFLKNGDDVKYFGNANRGFFHMNSVPNRESAARTILEREGILPRVSYEGKHKLYQLILNSGHVHKFLLSKPIYQNEDGIWAGERWVNSWGNVNIGGYNVALYKESHVYLESLQNKVDQGEEVWRLNPEDALRDYIYNVVGASAINDGGKIELIETKSPVSEFYKPVMSERYGYYEAFDRDEVITMIPVELVRQDDVERIKMLGIDKDKSVDGYYINELHEFVGLGIVSYDTVYSIINPKDVSGEKITVSKEDFKNHMDAQDSKTIIKINDKNGTVLEIEEVYLP